VKTAATVGLKVGGRVTLVRDVHDGAGRKILVRAGTGATLVSTHRLAPKSAGIGACVRFADGTEIDVVAESLRPRTKEEDDLFAAQDWRVEHLDGGPDERGRRRYYLYWNDVGGVNRPEPSKEDGRPVGYRRGQIFYSDRPPPMGSRAVASEG
jgi:hypothetical protein